MVFMEHDADRIRETQYVLGHMRRNCRHSLWRVEQLLQRVAMRLTHIASWSLMDAYSEDLRKKIVEAVEKRGMKKSEAARLFGVSLSSVKRYVRKFRQGSSLSPGKAPGKRPKIDECASRLLEADLKERPFAKLRQRCEYLRALAGLRVSRSTLCRALKRMGFTRKKGQWVPASETNG